CPAGGQSDKSEPLPDAREAGGELGDVGAQLLRLHNVEIEPLQSDVDGQLVERVRSRVQESGLLIDRLEPARGRRGPLLYLGEWGAHPQYRLVPVRGRGDRLRHVGAGVAWRLPRR